MPIVARLSRTSDAITTHFEPNSVSSRLASQAAEDRDDVEQDAVDAEFGDRPAEHRRREAAAERQQRVDAVLVDHARDEEAHDAEPLRAPRSASPSVRDRPARTAGASGRPGAVRREQEHRQDEDEIPERRQRTGGARVLALCGIEAEQRRRGRAASCRSPARRPEQRRRRSARSCRRDSRAPRRCWRRGRSRPWSTRRGIIESLKTIENSAATVARQKKTSTSDQAEPGAANHSMRQRDDLDDREEDDPRLLAARSGRRSSQHRRQDRDHEARRRRRHSPRPPARPPGRSPCATTK